MLSTLVLWLSEAFAADHRRHIRHRIMLMLIATQITSCTLRVVLSYQEEPFMDDFFDFNATNATNATNASLPFASNSSLTDPAAILIGRRLKGSSSAAGKSSAGGTARAVTQMRE